MTAVARRTRVQPPGALLHLRALDYRTAAAFVLPFVLYVLTLAPTVYGLDSAELTTAAAIGGLPRATGYPLYLMLGRVWSRLPIGDVGFRMNLFSAFWGAFTIALSSHYRSLQSSSTRLTMQVEIHPIEQQNKE